MAKSPVTLDYAPSAPEGLVIVRELADHVLVSIPPTGMRGQWPRILMFGAILCILPLLRAYATSPGPPTDSQGLFSLLRFAAVPVAGAALFSLFTWTGSGKGVEATLDAHTFAFRRTTRFANRTKTWPVAELDYAEFSTSGARIRDRSGATLAAFACGPDDARRIIIAFNRRLGRRFPKTTKVGAPRDAAAPKG